MSKGDTPTIRLDVCVISIIMVQGGGAIMVMMMTVNLVMTLWFVVVNGG